MVVRIEGHDWYKALAQGLAHSAPQMLGVGIFLLKEALVMVSHVNHGHQRHDHHPHCLQCVLTFY